MASLVSHALVGLTLGRLKVDLAANTRKAPAKFWLLSAVCACLPDADVVGFAMGIQYGDLLGHRGLTHSLLFALTMGFLVVALAFREEKALSPSWWGLLFYFALVTASHGILDALTNGGLGIAFFSPLDPTRYFFPFRPVAVSPIGVEAFFSARGLQVLLSELVWIGVPMLLVWGVVALRAKLTPGRR